MSSGRWEAHGVEGVLPRGVQDEGHALALPPGAAAAGGSPAVAAAAGEAPPQYLLLADAELLRQCQVDTFRASGPGGQHRNKTESAVRLRHTPTGLVSQSSEQRSQITNRATALYRLRQVISLKVRRPLEVAEYEAPEELLRILPPSAAVRQSRGYKQFVGPNHPDFLLGMQALLDVVAAYKGSVSDAAAIIGVSTGALSKVLLSDKSLMQEVNDLRAAQGLKPLR
eukprot:SM000077S21629  [mRNA]  locus=s77:587798:590727:- [translate_table: standard]